MQAPPPLPRSSFITTLGRISLLLACLTLAGALGQAAVAVAIRDATVAPVARLVADPAMQPVLGWMLGHRRLLSLLGLLLALLFLASSWGLLKRQEWARWGFIAFLLVTAALNFAGLPLAGQVIDGMAGAFPAQFLDTPEGRDFMVQMRANRIISMAMATVTAVALAGLHGWLAWKLCTPQVRAEFTPGAGGA